MAMTAYLVNTTKRINSTFQVPNTGSGIALTLSINLKDETDVIHPTFILNASTSQNPSAVYNYIKVPTLARSYFITKWKYNRGTWECDCVCDVLGSYKTSILAMEKYVTRTAVKAQSNGYIIDGMYPITDECVHNFLGKDLLWNRQWATGWYVVGIVGSGTYANAGSVNYYVLTAAELQSLVNYMLAGRGTSEYSVADLSLELEKIMADPFQYIVSCLFFPVQPPMDPNPVTLSFGYWTTTLSAHLLQVPYTTYKYYLDCFSLNLDIFGYTNTNNWPEYFYCNPYSTYALQFNPFGTIEIDGQLALKLTHIGVEMKVDFVSGTAFANFYAYNGISDPASFGRADRFLTTADAQLGIQVQLSNNTSTLLQKTVDTTRSIVGGAIQGAHSMSLAGAAGAIGGSLLDAIMSPINGTFEHRGSVGGIATDEGYLMLHIYRRIPAQFYPTELGYPCCKPIILTNLTGFTQCADGSNTVIATKDEKDMIASFLTEGFFIE